MASKLCDRRQSGNFFRSQNSCPVSIRMAITFYLCSVKTICVIIFTGHSIVLDCHAEPGIRYDRDVSLSVCHTLVLSENDAS